MLDGWLVAAWLIAIFATILGVLILALLALSCVLVYGGHWVWALLPGGLCLYLVIKVLRSISW